MKIYDQIIQGTPEWFEVRLGKFTASDAQAIANDGTGLTTLVFEKVAEKLTKKFKESYTNEDMVRGNELEALARDAYELETGIVVKQVGFIEKSDFVGCSPDGIIEPDGLLEIKCPSDTNFVKYMYEKKIDTKYIWQVQMQMLVSERNWVDFVIFNPNFPSPIIIERIERDENKIEKLLIGLESGQGLLERILTKVK